MIQKYFLRRKTITCGINFHFLQVNCWKNIDTRQAFSKWKAISFLFEIYIYITLERHTSFLTNWPKNKSKVGSWDKIFPFWARDATYSWKKSRFVTRSIFDQINSAGGYNGLTTRYKLSLEIFRINDVESLNSPEYTSSYY